MYAGICMYIHMYVCICMDLDVGWDIFFTSGAFLHVCLANYALHTNKRGNGVAGPAIHGCFFFATTVDGLEFSGPRIKRTVKARDKDVSR